MCVCAFSACVYLLFLCPALQLSRSTLSRGFVVVFRRFTPFKSHDDGIMFSLVYLRLKNLFSSKYTSRELTCRCVSLTSAFSYPLWCIPCLWHAAVHPLFVHVDSVASCMQCFGNPYEALSTRLFLLFYLRRESRPQHGWSTRCCSIPNCRAYWENKKWCI